MAAYAAVASLMNIIEQIMIHPRLSTSLDYDQIQPLHEKAGFLLEAIEDNSYGGGSKEAEELEIQIASAAHAAEDAIESHIVDQINAESARSSFLFSVQQKVSDMRNRFQLMTGGIAYAAHEAEDQSHGGSSQESLSVSLHLQQMVEYMEAILIKADQLKEKEGLRMREKVQFSHSTPHLDQTRETAMVGFEDELIQIMDELTNQRTSRQVISIVGMGGMGKTTLAHNLYENLLIKQYFDIRAWATVTQKHSVKEILSQLVSGQGKSSDRTEEELGEQLYKSLSGRRYLIILDDVWSVEAWDGVRHFFPDNGNRSRVVLTTRLSNVANHCGSSCFHKNLLNEKESWKLFCQKAFQHEDCPSELEEVGKEIVQLCKGLPLSIVVIGGSLLKSPRTLEHWKNVAEDIKSVPNSKEKQESLDVLISSYNHLPPYLKPCFLHVGVLKSSYSNMRVSEIIKLWVAEGFLRSNGGRVLEEIGEDYLKDLIDRNLIFVGRRSENGKMKCCDVHDLLRDLCSKLALQQDFFHVTRGETRGTERRLIYTELISGTADIPPLARSITLNPHDVPKLNLDKNRLLGVLDVSFRNSVKESFECVNLRYLALHKPTTMYNSYSWKMPSSVSLIWNLHTLIFRSTWYNVLVIAPVEIWKMRQLRHIKCPQFYLPHPSQGKLFILKNLQTLKRLMYFRLSEEVCAVISNVKKLYLSYDPRIEGYNDSLIDCLCNLSRLRKLESLKLIAKSQWPFGGPKMNKILTFPSSLTKLSLSDCKLHWDDLTMIGSLPLLEVLELEISSVMQGKRWSPVEGQFLSLKFLKIYCCDLVSWDAESCHFPVLERLSLQLLSDLEEIPWGIGEIPTLKLIHLLSCSDSAVVSAVRIKEEQLESQGNDDLQIQVTIFTKHLKRFYEMVEAEGVTLGIEIEIGEKLPSNSRPHLRETRETAMVGFEDELYQLMDVLTNQRTSRHIISIVGMGGMGKTTRARNVYENLLIKQHFDIRAWAIASLQYSAEEILSHFSLIKLSLPTSLE